MYSMIKLLIVLIILRKTDGYPYYNEPYGYGPYGQPYYEPYGRRKYLYLLDKNLNMLGLIQ